MTGVTAAPRAAAWRAVVRRARRRHATRTVGQVFTDLYILAWTVLVYGGVLVSVAVRRHRALMVAGSLPPEHQWIAVGVVLVLAGLTWQGVRTVGPMLASAAEQSWGLSAPIGRADWLMPRFLWLLTIGAGVGALIGAAAALLTLGGSLVLAAILGAALVLAEVTWAVRAQRVTGGSRGPGAAGAALLLLGAAAIGLGVAAHGGGVALPRITVRWLVPGALGLAVLAAWGGSAARRTLGRLDRVALGAGADVAGAATAAFVWLDRTLLTNVLEARRWRRVGRVRSRPFAFRAVGRVGALLQAELRRSLRRPTALATWAMLVLAEYAMGIVAPGWTGAAAVIGAYVAGGGFAAGLRTISGSPGLRRMLGGTDRGLSLTHLIVPAAAAAAWWIATWPVRPHFGIAELGVFAGIVLAIYRGASRPPMEYDGGIVETPIGLVPVGLLMQLARGPDVLGLVLIGQALINR